MKKLIWTTFAVVMVVVGAVWLIKTPRPDHIEDTNGADNYELQQITEQDVIDQAMGSRGGISTTETSWNIAGFAVSDGVEYSCRKFTGVYELYTCTIFKGSDIHLYLADFQIRNGNFAFYILLDGEIVGKAEPDEFGVVELIIENIEKTGTLEYIIAGESASFTFTAPLDW